MKVRVFLPPVKEGGDYHGSDYEFETMPETGQMIRFIEHPIADFEVEKVGFIQEGEAFVASVWLKPDEPPYNVGAWIEGMAS